MRMPGEGPGRISTIMEKFKEKVFKMEWFAGVVGAVIAAVVAGVILSRLSKGKNGKSENGPKPIQSKHSNEDNERKYYEKRYLKRVIAKCDPLDLTVTEETCESSDLTDKLPQIRVSDVFTTLYLKNPERRSDQTVKDAIEKRGEGDRFQEKDYRKEEKRIPIQAVEAAAAVQRMVMLGRPGGGKSTLVNYVAAQLARRRLGEQEKEDNRLFTWPSEDKPLPLIIILRQMAAWINETVNRGNEGLVWEYLEHMLGKWGCAEFVPSCKQILDEKGGVIFFDGLDEVGEANEGRKRTIILQAVRDFARPLNKCRVIVTCREYAYQKKENNQNIDWRLPEGEFPVTELDLFRDEQIKSFSKAWYRITGPRKGWSLEKCDGEAEAFYQAVLLVPNLKSLGENPLLLTLMAQIHGRLGYLPKDRADLYERVVRLLLAHWDNRIVRDEKDVCRIENWVVMRLGVPVDILREPLERVAFNAHEQQEKAVKDEFTCADISREDLRTELAAKLKNDLTKAEEFIEYIENRAGLLQGVDNRTFRFPHRTFQEYLTATGIMRRGNFVTMLIERLRRDPFWWQEVFLLAAGSARNIPFNIYSLLNALLPKGPESGNLNAQNVVMSKIAARTIFETDFIDKVKEEKRNSDIEIFSTIHGRIQEWLMKAMTADTIFTPEQRSDAGNALNWVEDPRFNPDRWFLPNDDNLGFVTISAGPFKMGSDKARDSVAYENETPQHTVILSEYAIGKYPVTVAQYRVFAEVTGKELDEDWQKYNRYDNHPSNSNFGFF